MQSSGNDRGQTLITLCALGLYKTKTGPVSSPSQVGEGIMGYPSLMKYYEGL